MPPLSLSTRLTLLALLSSSSLYFLLKSRLLHKIPLLLLSQNPKITPNPKDPNPKIFYLSQTGTSKALSKRLPSLLPNFILVDPSSYEPEDILSETVVIFIASTWDDGGPPDGSKFLVDFIADSAADFRVGRVLEGRCRFAVFGVGSKGYGEERYNKVGRDLRRWLKELGGEEVVGFGEGDVDEGRIVEVFDEWTRKLVGVLVKDETGMLTKSEKIKEVDEGEVESEEEEEDLENGVVDLEDVAGKWVSSRKNGVGNGGRVDVQKEMVTPVIRASLEKQVINVFLWSF